IYWLLDEWRTLVVNNYSYTLSHPDQKTLKDATIVAFTHFCWLYSKNTLVFADMQGSQARNASGSSIEVLFDPMTHSLSGDTGLGDYGQEGINIFLAQHHCNRICTAMGLERLDDP
ncbi:kinase-like protein, partial [Ramaria rubella]